MTKLLLTVVFGWAGYYRFCKGQIFLGLLYLFTFGLFFVGWAVDVLCALGDFLRGAASRAEPAPPPAEQPYAPRPSSPFEEFAPAPTEADELLKYKKLLDMQAITPEEYERKKKSLLSGRSEGRVCAYCGRRNDENASVCKGCGARLG